MNRGPTLLLASSGGHIGKPAELVQMHRLGRLPDDRSGAHWAKTT